MKWLLLYSVLIFSVIRAHAQGENNVWCFGHSLKLNFNQAPAQLVQSNMNTYESNSAVCDATGNLLFYTMGSRIWDKNGNEMPNSYGLLGNGPVNNGIPYGSSANGVVIVRNPANINQYYIFSGDAYEDTTKKLYYSMVDMALNNGLGDVMPAIKNIVLMDNVSEQICSTNGPDCKSSWIIARDRNWNYNAFRIDVNGVSTTPVVTPPNGNLISPFLTSNLTFFTDGITAASGGPCLTIEKFDNNTGVFSDFLLLDTFISSGTYNPEFSPDGSKLYYTYNGSTGAPGIFQMDLSLLPDVQAVKNSATQIAITNPQPQSDHFVSSLRRGPDGKIYVLDWVWNNPQVGYYVGRFENPDIAGVGCNYTPAFFTIQSDSFFSTFGSPVFIKSQDTTFHQIDTSFCEGASIQLSSSVDNADYIWNNNTSTSQTVTISTPGIYCVNASRNGCSYTTDSFFVSQQRFILRLNNDTTICRGDTIALNAITEGLESTLLWNTGERINSILIYSGGIYSVTAQNACGTFNDSTTIDIIGCNCIPFLPTAFSPNSDLLNDDFGPVLDCGNLSDYNFSIYNRYGERVFFSNNPMNKWNGDFNGAKADIGAYFYFLTFRRYNEPSLTYKGDVILIR